MKRAIKNAMITAATVIGLTTATSAVRAAPAHQPVAAAAAKAGKVKCARSGHAFARGYCGVVHSKNPEGWVRGKASVDPSTGLLTMHFQLETDSTTHGPCGKMHIVLRNAAGEDLAKLGMKKQLCRGGKPPGRAAKTTWTTQEYVPMEIATQVASVHVAVSKTGRVGRLWDISLSDLKDAIEVVVLVGSTL